MKSISLAQGAFALLIFFTLLTNAVPSMALPLSSSSCQQEYSSWVQSFGASDPFLSSEKTTPWNVDKDLLNQIITSDAKDFGQSFFKTLTSSNARTRKIKASDFHDYVVGLSDDPERDSEIKQNLMSFFGQKPSSDTILIGYVGEHHAIDFFITNPSLPLTYMVKPFGLRTQFNSPEYNEFMTSLGQSPMMTGNIENWAGFFFTAPYASAYAMAKRHNLSKLPSEAFEARSTDLKKILVGEFHNVRSTKITDSLPDPDCLRSLGISKIQVGLEGYSKAEIVTPLSAIKRRNFIEGFTYFASKLQKTLPEYMELIKANKNISNDMMAQFYAGKIVDNVGMVALLNKMEEFAQNGIEIKIIGLEKENFAFPEKQ